MIRPTPGLRSAVLCALVAFAAAPGAEAAEGTAARDLLRERWEVGVAVPEGYFEWLGTAAYMRRVRDEDPFTHLLRAEVAGGSRGYLSEGTASLYYLLRPRMLAPSLGPIRTALEFGPGGHITVQSASIEGFDDSSVHAEAYLKSHAYGWILLDMGSRAALGISGRFTIPNHRPLDYAQAALLFR